MSNSNSNTTTTVVFDVGGTVYKVSRSLLNQYPTTMLARMVSDTWNGVDDDDRIDTTNDPLFVDRDGERFRYILDYMRDGPNISLPVTVSKDNFLIDLEYFGFENINPDSFGLTPSYAVYQNMLDQMNVLDTKLSSKNDTELRQQSTQLELENRSQQLARYCFLRFQFSGNLTVNMCEHRNEEFYRSSHKKYNDSDYFEQMRSFAYTFRVTQIVCFNKYLLEYGLKFLKSVGHNVIILEIAMEEISKK